MEKYDDTQKTSHTTAGEVVSEAVPQYKPASEILAPEPGKLYTYSDYITWNDGKRYELIDGVAYEMDAPPRSELIDGIPFILSAPTRRHQEILFELAVQLRNFLKGKPCKVYVAPFDIHFNADGADNTVLQPDISIICDHSKLTDAGCNGAPDLAIEILSPSTTQRDRLVKLKVYEKYGVREYWIVEPENNAVTVYTLENGRYFVNVHTEAGTVPVNILDGCVIDLTEIFSESGA